MDMEEQDRRFSDGAVLPGGKKPELRSNLLATELELQTPGEGSRRRAAGGGRLETSTSFDVRESSSSSSSGGTQRNQHVPNPPPSTPRASLEEGALQQQLAGGAAGGGGMMSMSHSLSARRRQRLQRSYKVELEAAVVQAATAVHVTGVEDSRSAQASEGFAPPLPAPTTTMHPPSDPPQNSNSLDPRPQVASVQPAQSPSPRPSNAVVVIPTAAPEKSPVSSAANASEVGLTAPPPVGGRLQAEGDTSATSISGAAAFLDPASASGAGPRRSSSASAEHHDCPASPALGPAASVRRLSAVLGSVAAAFMGPPGKKPQVDSLPAAARTTLRRKPVTFDVEKGGAGPSAGGAGAVGLVRDQGIMDDHLIASSSGVALGEDQVNVEIDLSLFRRVGTLEFPAADDRYDEEVATVIKKSLKKWRMSTVDLAPPDAIASLVRFGQFSQVSLQSQVDQAVLQEGDEFWEKVTHKTQSLDMGRYEAIFEVYTDMLVERSGDCSAALFCTLTQDFKEFPTDIFVTKLLDRGADVKVSRRDGTTPLHLAAMKGFVTIGKKLIEHQAPVTAVTREGKTPLHLALEKTHGPFATLMVKNTDPAIVRKLFQAEKNGRSSQLSLHVLLEEPKLKCTTMAVLDTMMEPLEGHPNTFVVHYSILDSDTEGRPPSQPTFDRKTKSCLQKIAKSNNKEAIYHDVVRLLLRRKWKKFARYAFILQAVYYLVTMVTLTCAFMLAASRRDPRGYDRPEDVFRGLCEGVAFVLVGYNGISEINQIRIHRLNYLQDEYNYLDASSVVLTFLVIPFRIANHNIQWIFAALSYLTNGLRSFKYAAVLRSTGAYVQILIKILVRDLVPFTGIFALILVSFSGAFYLVLRGQVLSDGGTGGAGGTLPSTNHTNHTNHTSHTNHTVDGGGDGEFVTGLDNHPYETRSVVMEKLLEQGKLAREHGQQIHKLLAKVRKAKNASAQATSTSA